MTQQKVDYVILDIIENTARNIKAQPVNLGGVAGVGGGEGGPPGGFIGWLPQTRVAYDTDEAATLSTVGSGTLLDNLNHIRYRLQQLELSSGILNVDDGITFVSDVQELTFSGGVTVTQLSPGHALVTVTASGGGGGIEDAPTNGQTYGRKDASWQDLDSKYLRLDAQNSPVTGPLYVEVEDDQVFEIDQVAATNGDILSAAGYSLRYANGSTNTAFTEAHFFFGDYTDTGITFEKGLFEYWLNDSILLASINPHAAVDGIVAVINSVNNITESGRLLSLKNQDVEKLGVDGLGNVNIPLNRTYNINGIPHTHDLVSGASNFLELDDTPSSYTGSAGKSVVVNQTEDGLEFTTVSGGSGTPLVVEEYDGSPSINNVDKIIFSGATVTDLGSGDVLVTISGGSGVGSFEVHEDFSPTSDGVTHYDSLHVIESGTLSLYYNGLRQEPIVHYTEDEDGGGFTVLFSPESGDTLLADYLTTTSGVPAPSAGTTIVNNSLSTFGSRNLLGANNSSNPDTEIDFSADVVILWNPSNLTSVIRLNTGTLTNNTSAAGPTANGRDQSGAFSNSSWVHFYFIWDGTTLATLSSTAVPSIGPTLPSGYTHWCYIGTVYKLSSGNLYSVIIRNDKTFYNSNLSSLTILSNGSATSTTSIDASSVVPPNAINFGIILEVEYFNSSADVNVKVTVNYTSAVTVLARSFTIFSDVANQWTGYTATMEVPNVSQTLYYSWGNTGSRALDITVNHYTVSNGAS